MIQPGIQRIYTAMNRSKKPRAVSAPARKDRPRVTRDLIMRTATAPDAKALARLAAEVNEPALTLSVLKRQLFGPKSVLRALVAVLDGEIVAAALYIHTFDATSGARGLFLPALLINAAAHARSVGRPLLAACAAYAKKSGGHFVHWATGAWSVDAHDYYRRMGAAEVPIMAHSVAGAKFTLLAKEGVKHLAARAA